MTHVPRDAQLLVGGNVALADRPLPAVRMGTSQPQLRWVYTAFRDSRVERMEDAASHRVRTAEAEAVEPGQLADRLSRDVSRLPLSPYGHRTAREQGAGDARFVLAGC